MKETEIQNSILDYLDWNCIFYQRTNNIPAPLGGGRKGFRSMPKGSKKGFPDIVAIVNGYFVGLEVKNEKGKASVHQLEMKKQVENAGGYYFIVRSIEDVKKAIQAVRNGI